MGARNRLMDRHASHVLAPNAHFAWIGRDLVTLDVARDAYCCWANASAYVVDAGRRRVIISDGDVVAALMDQGLLAPAGAPCIEGPPPPPAPTVDHHNVQVPGCSVAERVDFAVCAMRMAIDYHGRSTGHLIRQARREAIPADPDPDQLVRRATLFAAWAPWVPFQGVCLYRSFLLLRFLRAAGLSATWVFGVRTWPFSAHCWLQSGSLLLDDDVDRVSTYTPILAV